MEIFIKKKNESTENMDCLESLTGRLLLYPFIQHQLLSFMIH